MRTRLVAQLVQAPTDLDYVGHLQVLNALNLEIRRHGPSSERLIRKAILELDVGNYPASLAAAQDACSMHPSSPETHRQVGLSYLFLGLAKAGLVPLGPGSQEGAPDSVTGMLWRAVEAFQESLMLNPQDDETLQTLKTLHAVLADHKDEESLLQALRTPVA